MERKSPEKGQFRARALILIQFKLHYQKLVQERKAKGIKRKVSSKEVWKIINKTLKDAKKNEHI